MRLVPWEVTDEQDEAELARANGGLAKHNIEEVVQCRVETTLSINNYGMVHAFDLNPNNIISPNFKIKQR